MTMKTSFFLASKSTILSILQFHEDDWIVDNIKSISFEREVFEKKKHFD